MQTTKVKPINKMTIKDLKNYNKGRKMRLQNMKNLFIKLKRN